MKNFSYGLASILSVLLLVVAFGVFNQTAQVAQGSVPVANEYQSTTTPNGIGPVTPIFEGRGALGSVVITGAGAGTLMVLDATTTDITKRKSTMSTSSIMIANFPKSAAAGTYTFDVMVTNGLMITAEDGAIATTTTTFRQL